MAKPHFSSLRMDWKTPKAVYQVLDAEFQFDHDPCPPNFTVDGLTSNWGGVQLLDEILATLDSYDRDIPKAKNLILQWVADEVIGANTHGTIPGGFFDIINKQPHF